MSIVSNLALTFWILGATLLLPQYVLASEKLEIKLLDAVIDEDIAKVKSLLKKGANPNSIDALYEKRTAMGWASQHKESEILMLLIHAGGDVNLFNVKDSWSPYPLYNALMADRIDNFKLLLAYGANPNAVDNNQRIPFMAAVASGDWEFAFLLLQAGTKLDFRNRWGETPKSVVENQGLRTDSEWRKKVFDFFTENGISLTSRVPL